jgi:Fe-S oxidoreductase
VKIPDIVLTLRNLIVEKGMTPDGIQMLSNTIIENYNPLAQSHDNRTNWIDIRKNWNKRLIKRIKNEEDKLKLKYVELGTEELIKAKAETVYFVGCNSSYPRINMGIPDAFVHIMHAVGEDFTLLGQDERCCADPIFLGGYQDAFTKLAEHNLKEVEKRGATKLVMTCAGCYRVFKHEYPKYLDDLPDLEIIHATELLDQYIKEGRLEVSEKQESQLKVTYHDPCEIGRVGRIFEPPRQVLEGIGIPVLEMVEEREQSFCCGGGGLVKVSDQEISSKLSFTRIGQAEDVGAEIITSACPSCKTTIRDGVLSLGKKIGVMDITELVAQQLGLVPAQR